MEQRARIPELYSRTMEQCYRTMEHGFGTIEHGSRTLEQCYMMRDNCFSITLHEQRFEAPIDGDYQWSLFGAEGGSDIQETRSTPGKGGRVKVTQKGVKKGTMFTICIGEQGEDTCHGSTVGGPLSP